VPVKPRPAKRTRWVGAACLGRTWTVSAVTREVADTAFAGLPVSDRVTVNTRSPRR
jgi:hypothetical protein